MLSPIKLLTTILLTVSTKSSNNNTQTEIMKSPMIAMHWFRKGLRIHDNPGLAFACSAKNNNNNSDGSSSSSSKNKLYPVYVMDGDCYQIKHCTALRANFLVECLQDLDNSLRKKGSRLYVASGDPVDVLPELWSKWGITHMTFEEDETGEPYAKERDEQVMKKAKECGIQVQTFASETLHPLQKYVDFSSKVPITMGAFQAVFNKAGRVPLPKDAPKTFPPSSDNDDGDDDATMLPPKKPTDLPWPRGIPKSEATPLWGVKECKNLKPIVRGGETNALKQLKKKVLEQPTYVATFEKPKTSCVDTKDMSTTILSPYISLGCISPRKFWYAIEESSSKSNATKSKPPVSLHGQLLWRDFNHLMAHTANKNQPGSWGQIEGNMHCRPIPWSDDPEFLEAWKNGRTGYPWIDACMKQLEQEGWIHHLGRHAVACFLTRGDLWQSWEKGAHHFESHLLDADYALNGFNWLWLSCSGFFYQYFRCYSPVAFQQKNDPNGNYIRKYLPELKGLPSKYIYEPWKAPRDIQEKAGVRIGKDYPRPIVEHSYVSKENMSKMKYAYDEYKDAQKDAEKSSSESKKRANAKDTTPKSAPKRKRQMKVTDY